MSSNIHGMVTLRRLERAVLLAPKAMMVTARAIFGAIGRLFGVRVLRFH